MWTGIDWNVQNKSENQVKMEQNDQKIVQKSVKFWLKRDPKLLQKLNNPKICQKMEQKSAKNGSTMGQKLSKIGQSVQNWFKIGPKTR